MIDRATLLERHFPERYVAGQLSPEETTEFEEYLLENPEVIDQVEIARQLKLGLRTLSEEGKLAEVIAPRTAPRRWLMAASIAALALMLGLSTWFLRTGPTLLAASLEGLGESRPIAGEYMLGRIRGVSQQTIPLAAQPAAVALRFEAPQAGADSSFTAELKRGGNVVASVNELRPGADGLITIYLEASRLEPGDYVVQVHGNQADAATSEFPLRLEPPGR
jgi:hypothetical protein